MIQKWIGAACIFISCSGAGFLTAAAYRREEKLLYQTLRFLEKMECELRCRVSPLPQLCNLAADCGEVLSKLYGNLSEELACQVMPDADCCMQKALERTEGLPRSVRELHTALGRSLGKFDLDGQLQELNAIKEQCRQILIPMENDRQEKVRSYRTLGLCAGAALAIFFF